MQSSPSLTLEHPKPSLTLERRFKASPAQLFQAWTQPEKMIRWWGVTGHANTPIAKAELRVGGRFNVVDGLRPTSGFLQWRA